MWLQMLEGIQIKPLKRIVDERGFILELMRKDWKEILKEDPVQANLSITYPGIIRAWHIHTQGKVEYFIALRGAIKICAYEEESGELNEIISAGSDPQIVRIPGIYWHGFKAVSNEPLWLLYFINRFYDPENPDEGRRPWDDPTIVPRSINGRTDDSRVGKAWSWTLPPHK